MKFWIKQFNLIMTRLYLVLLLIPFARANSWEGEIKAEENVTFMDIDLCTDKYTTSKWRFSINITSYDVESQTPILYLRPVLVPVAPYIVTEQDCLQKVDVYSIYANRNPLVVPLSVETIDVCRQNGEGGLICNGIIQWLSPVPCEWLATIAYPCNTSITISPPPPPLKLKYTISVEPNPPIRCQRTRNQPGFTAPWPQLEYATQRCSQFYPKFTTYNVYGLSPLDLGAIVAQMGIATSAMTRCYEYVWEYLCRFAIPQCDDRVGVRRHICREMCEDFSAACGHVPATIATDIWSRHAREVLQWLHACHILPSRDQQPQCIYRPVTCTDPIQTIPHASMDLPPPTENKNNKNKNNTWSVHTRAIIQCDKGYEQLDNISAVCEYNGEWRVPEDMICVRIERANTRQIIIIASSICGAILLIIILCLILGARYRYELTILAHKHCRGILCLKRMRTHSHKQYHIIIASCEEDRHYVQTELHEPLERDGLQLFVDYRDGHPNRAPAAYLPEAMARSHGVLIVLNQLFLADNLCRYLLAQAFYQSLEGDPLRTLVVHNESLDKLPNMPRHMRRFIRTHCVSIHMKDSMLHDKIKYEIGNRQLSKQHT